MISLASLEGNQNTARIPRHDPRGPRIHILTTGSRGDVQPYLALAKGLQASGLDVTLVTHEPFQEFVTAEGVKFRSMGGDPRKALETEAGKALLDTGDNPRVFFRRMIELAEPAAADVARQAWEAVQDADVLLCGTNAYFLGEALAEKLQCPISYLSLQPMAPTTEQQGVFERSLPPRLQFLRRWGYHKLLQSLGLQVYAHFYRNITRSIREEVLQLPKRSRWFAPKTFTHGPLFLYGYSQHVIPRPSDWAPTQQVCGYWILPPADDWQPSHALQSFLQAGPPPVYIGFGSMPSDEPAVTRALVVEALRATGQRAVVSRGWGGLSAADWPDNVAVVDDVPHEWLFRHVSAVVHHGGAGTTAAGLRAGAPTIIVPHMADQPYWGRRVQSLGVGTAPIRRQDLNSTTLAAAIRQATQEESLREAVQRLSQRLLAEDGVSTAVQHIRRSLKLTPTAATPVSTRAAEPALV